MIHLQLYALQFKYTNASSLPPTQMPMTHTQSSSILNILPSGTALLQHCSQVTIWPVASSSNSSRPALALISRPLKLLGHSYISVSGKVGRSIDLAAVLQPASCGGSGRSHFIVGDYLNSGSAVFMVWQLGEELGGICLLTFSSHSIYLEYFGSLTSANVSGFFKHYTVPFYLHVFIFTENVYLRQQMQKSMLAGCILSQSSRHFVYFHRAECHFFFTI